MDDYIHQYGEDIIAAMAHSRAKAFTCLSDCEYWNLIVLTDKCNMSAIS